MTMGLPDKNGLITFDMSSSTAQAQKKVKRRRKKKVIKAPKKTYGLDGIVTSFAPNLLKSYNKFVLKDPKDRMFFYDNYQAMIFNFIEVLPNLDAKKFLVRARSSLIKELFQTTLYLVSHEEKVYFSEMQNLVSRPRIFPLNFSTKNPVWDKFITAKERGYNTYDRMEKRIKETP